MSGSDSPKPGWDVVRDALALVLAIAAIAMSAIAIQHSDDASRRAEEVAALGLQQNLAALSAEADLSAFELSGPDTVISVDARVFNDGGRPATLVRLALDAVGAARPTLDNVFKKSQLGSQPPFFSFPSLRASPSVGTPSPPPSLVAVIEQPSSPRHDLKPAIRVETGGVADFALKLRLPGVAVRNIDELRSAAKTQRAVAVLKFFDQGERAVAVTLWDCGLLTLGLTATCGGTAFQ
jgi:hypothetical protein